MKLYDLIQLESNSLHAYQLWKGDKNSAQFRTEMFKAVEELAFAVLNLGNFEKYGIDYAVCAYEYSLYLFERIITGSFRMEPKIPGTRFPLQEYVRLNIKHVVFTLKKETAWQDLITDMEFFLEDYQKPGDYEYLEIQDPNQTPPEEKVLKYEYADKLLAALKVYYPYSEIRRLLAISLDLIYLDSKALINPKIPADIQDFCITLVSLAKRLALDHNLNSGLSDISKSNLKKIFSSSVRSTIFLSTVVNTEFFPRELLLSLDIESLYRLVHVLGGQKVRIPTIKELDSLLGAVVAMGKIIMEGKEIDKAIQESKSNFNLVFSTHIKVQDFVTKSLDSYNIFNKESKVEPLLNILAMAIKSMDVLFQQLTQRAETMESSEMIKNYVDLSSQFSQFTQTLIQVSEKVKANEPVQKLVEELENSPDYWSNIYKKSFN